MSRDQRILVWDLPLRVFHWALAGSILGAFLTAESERWRDVHAACGYGVLVLVGFRLVWALVGTRYARFSALLHGPAAIARYLASLLRGEPEHHVGHNPPGALAIPVLLGLCVATAASGWAVLAEVGGEWLEEAHEAFAISLLVLVGVHVVGVLASSLAHRENLVASMLHGRKRGSASEGVSNDRRWIAALLLAAVAGVWVAALGDRVSGAQGSRVVEARVDRPAEDAGGRLVD